MSNWLSKFAKDLVGSDTDQVWKDFASVIGADFVPRDLWRNNSNKILCQSSSGVIALDTTLEGRGEMNLTVTRARAAYLSQECFDFAIYRKTL